MKNFLALILFVSSLTLFSQDKAKVEQLVSSFSSGNNNAAVVYLDSKDGNDQVYSAGFFDVENKIEVKPDNLFEIGSASKIYTAISIMQLIEQGKFDLDTKINTFFKEENVRKLANIGSDNYFDDVTVEMLLNHTSGFKDYLNGYGDDNKALEVFSDANKIYSFNDIIDIALSFGEANFKAGEKFVYCNTGYILLGEIIERVSKKDWRTYIKENIFDKAQLKHSYFGSQLSKKQKDNLCVGYYGTKKTQMPYTLAGSAGEIVADANDLKLFIQAWKSGKFFEKKETLEKQLTSSYNQMYAFTDLLNYGLGVIKIKNSLGHAGQTFGFQSYIGFDKNSGEVYVLVVNNASAQTLNFMLGIVK